MPEFSKGKIIDYGKASVVFIVAMMVMNFLFTLIGAALGTTNIINAIAIGNFTSLLTTLSLMVIIMVPLYLIAQGWVLYRVAKWAF